MKTTIKTLDEANAYLIAQHGDLDVTEYHGSEGQWTWMGYKEHHGLRLSIGWGEMGKATDRAAAKIALANLVKHVLGGK